VALIFQLLGLALLLALPARKNDFAATRHVPMGSKYTKNYVCGRSPDANAFMV